MKGAVSFEPESEVVAASALPCERMRKISYLLDTLSPDYFAVFDILVSGQTYSILCRSIQRQEIETFSYDQPRA